MNILKLSFLIFLLFALNSCDFLGYDETSTQSKNAVFYDYGRTTSFLTNIYRMTPGGFNSVGGAMRASGSDDAEEINSQSTVQGFNNGSWSAINTLDAEWGSSYKGIRATNIFLNNFNIEHFTDLKYNSDYDNVLKKVRLYPYQARFLRAFFYFELIKRYRNVPLIKKVLKANEANNVQPSSYDKVTNFIVNECDSIIPYLPVDYHSVPNNETGRVTRGAAMALKARALLYAASPLHNSSDERQKWIKAAKAAKAIIDSSYYSLANNYRQIFINTRKSSELIWGRRHSPSNSFEQANFPVSFEGSDPGTAPTQNLVDAYEIQSNGKGINKSGSGYDPSHPYRKRDPRLKYTIIVNNSNWKGHKVEIWRGGQDGPPKVHATKTGYYLKKYLDPNISLKPNHTTSSVHTWIVFRYGGILLDYAEAMNESYGPEDPAAMGMTARQAVNMIRERVNMPDFPTGMSKGAFREKLYNERRVEMAFENQRFWDIRRWKIGPSTTDIKGMEIKRISDSSFTYHRKTVEHRMWNNKMYLYPIPQNEIAENDALTQNPGW